MKHLTLLILLFTSFAFSQNEGKEKEQLLATKKSNDFVYEANELMDDDNFISAEKEYRKAISKQPTSVAGNYNLGNSYYKKGNYEEALYRQQQAAKNAIDKSEKHKAFHNIGNILMKNKQCKQAVEAYKNALRNDPTDDETRYNLGLAKECAEQQKDDQPDENQDKDKEKNDENKDKDQDKDNKDQQDQDNKKDDQKDQDKKEGDDKKDEGKPKDEEGKDENQQQKPQPGKLSPQQIKNLLEAMNNQEQKVQEKMNAEKQKGIKVKTEKDW
ncbi:tetratricopeptide repeat protein [Gelidibacter salicanalis]|uniref:Tetratricopeptide repeat protein n=1 Tax=Gelidibacter salicanalis TaxID=291193 RepID=A0A934KUC0_9FLAO|nr:tetratricopeptide repeat protein [Gelidibacter salicanalis]MBJ7880923.1 tetratricopeptide repeat protein [Gelidibacter salicanalis]